MQAFVELAERQPQLVCPVTAGRIHCLLIGLPGIDQVFERFVEASGHVTVDGHAPWQLAALAVEGWVHLWHGDAVGAQATIDRADVLHQQFGGIRLIGERLGQLRAMHAAARGRHDEALAIARRHVDGMRAPELAPHRAVWLRAYQHGYARMLWMAGRDAEYLDLVPALTAPRTAQEWGWVEVAADVSRGHAALLRGQPREALAPLERACVAYQQHCLPSVYCDPRVALAAARTALRDRDGAWQAFEPLYRGAVERGEFGPILLDSRRHVVAVVDGLPTGIREAPDTVRLRECLHAWGKVAAIGHGTRVEGPLARLSEREREVLAAVAGGAGNKHIARALDLSLHTVKRHIANILDKLDCASRGQAAEIYRRAAQR
jgi:LuxR family maltose regulon positive regulatory protein